MTDLVEISNESIVVVEEATDDTVIVTADASDVVEIGYVSGGFIPVPGPKGDTGDTGPQGPPGAITATAVQVASPSTSWTTTHTLNRHPIVVCLDINGDEITGDVHTTTTTVQVTWALAVAGTLLLY